MVIRELDAIIGTARVETERNTKAVIQKQGSNEEHCNAEEVKKLEA